MVSESPDPISRVTPLSWMVRELIVRLERSYSDVYVVRFGLPENNVTSSPPATACGFQFPGELQLYLLPVMATVRNDTEAIGQPSRRDRLNYFVCLLGRKN